VFLMARGRHDEAIARSQLAAELDPLALAIQALIGQCHHFAGRFDEALVRHRSTLELDPGNLQALLWSSRTYRALRRPADALPLVERALAQWGRTPALLGELGTVLPPLGRQDEARAVLAELGGMAERRYVSPFFEAGIYGALGLEEQCRYMCERTEEARSGIIPFLCDPAWHWYVESAWFRELLRRTGVR